ncbi:transcription initiation factor TFIID subunit 11 [Diospyros lotus]|uniref:transcription initiation factor TFIID subunit 11 n=1 Tax=Diospyros lotus TaxID=55363 RepID=UPI00224F3A96|nr:transcription initiation factor TFIID subunit 11 [Diospyros lotus]
MIMKQSKDPFEVAFEEQKEESPPGSPITAPDGLETQINVQSESAAVQFPVYASVQEDDDDIVKNTNAGPSNRKPLKYRAGATAAAAVTGKNKEEDEEEEDNMDVDLAKLPSTSDPDKMSKMQAILSRFTGEQMSRYESFRRSGFQKANMKRLLSSITGSAKISVPMTIVVSGIAKMFVGELVETARIVMAERKESGPIRPCHVREAYRRLKLEGKIPKRSVPRLFR